MTVSCFVRGRKKQLCLLTILVLFAAGTAFVFYSLSDHQTYWSESDEAVREQPYWSYWTDPDKLTEIAEENPATRLQRSFSKEVLEWVRSVDQSLQLIVLEPRIVRCLATGRGCQKKEDPEQIRIAVALRNGCLFQQISSASSSWTIDSPMCASGGFLVLRRAGQTVLLSVIDYRSKYWYVHGSDREFNGSDIDGREPPRAFLGLNLTRFESADMNIWFPSPVEFYLWQWPRSRFLECNRTSADRLRRDHPEIYALPPVVIDSFVDKFAHLRNLAMGHGMALMLIAGTALGWYRECSIIPYTDDIDAVFLASEWKPGMEEIFKSESPLKLKYITGRTNDSWKAFFSGKGGKVDLWALYEDGDRTHFSSIDYLAKEKTKLRWYFPRFQGTCTCDLKGHLFFVRCDTLATLIVQYGPEYYKIQDSTKFFWRRSSRNLKEYGIYSDAELPSVYRKF